jgi:hypothetical protein
MAASNTAFYYSRHFLPYDCAICAALCASIVALRPPTFRRALLCGVLLGGTYQLYNGYWYLVPIIWSVHFITCRSCRSLSIVSAAAGAATAVVPIIVGLSYGGSAYLATLRSFAGSATMGLFAEGWSLPWEYLWTSERGLGVAVFGCILASASLALFQRKRVPRWVCGTAAALVAAYGLLVLFSNGCHVFVVYARTVKPFIPLICLLGGWAAYRLLNSARYLTPVAVVLVVCAATLSFWPHFSRVFPFEVETAVLRNWGSPKRTLSIAGTFYSFSRWPVNRPDLALVNARELYPVRNYVGYPAGKAIFRVEHPLAYRPFQYECHTPRERHELRNHDISIQLIQLDSPSSLSDQPPADMLYQLSEKPNGYERSR